jgi:O-antigen/teichoic acid export membrane protein
VASIKKSFFWSGIEQVGPQIVRFILFVVLARMLEPADFGLVAMLAIFLALAGVFLDAGFSAALIQKKELSADEETSIFALNVCIGFVLAGLLCLVSPLVADFYRQPVLSSLLCVNSLTLVIGSFGLVQSTLMIREMLFEKTAFIAITCTTVSGATGIIMAFLGYGVWSLLGVSLSESLVRVVLYCKLSKWRPRGAVRWQNIREMWTFSSRLLICNIIGVVYQNAYAVIIGRIYSPESLGYFNRANQLRMFPVNILSGMVNRVTFPLFSRQQDDKNYLLGRMREIIRSMLFLSATAMVLLAVIADPLIPFLLTEKWRPTIPLLRILCFAGVTYPVHALYLITLQAQGLSHLNLRLEMFKVSIGLISIAFVYRYGVTALAWNMAAIMVLSYFVNAWYNVKLLGYRWRLQAFDILSPFSLSLVAGGVAWLLGEFAPVAPVVTLAIQVTSFLLLILLGVYALRKVFFAEVWGHFVWAFIRVRQLVYSEVR